MARTEDMGSMAIGVIQTGVGLLPVAWWLSMVTYAWRASRFLGHWPSYDNPDPKSMPVSLVPPTTYLDWIVAVSGAVLGFVALAFVLRRIRKPKLRMLCGSAFLFGGWIAGFALLWLDPGGVFEWICD